MGDDDILDPNEIEALLSQTAGGGASEPPPSEPASDSGAGDSAGGSPMLDPDEIAALMAGGPDTGNAAEQSLNAAQSNLAAAVAPDISSFGKIPSELGNPSPFAPNDFGTGGDRSAGGVGLNALRDVEFDLHIELGRTDMMMEEVLSIKEGAVVPLDKLAGDPVDIIANGRLIARGEVLVLNDNFCVRVAEILTPNF
ncbi:Flagellar motor switch protein FliN [Polystyrenella longa]|uniref:Flagellar motor switch protein FliN n=1 Tax=Polystyrenella longa TaxID=2528007 RepID=A0A518CIS0_9PLAN|nr:flagellar motor switch protein FliN [Polystyrenella longa]QDU79126.1 Flagellar motor switch protein FliN [Polystyrenella longa]